MLKKVYFLLLVEFVSTKVKLTCDTEVVLCLQSACDFFFIFLGEAG